MRPWLGLGLLLAFSASAFAQDSLYPDWAYGIRPAEPAAKDAPRDDSALQSLPGAAGSFTRAKIAGRNPDGTRTAPADWYPGDHPVMPKLVAEGDTAHDIAACAACHYPNGKGRPQNTALAGLPADYMLRQLQDMKSGARRSAEPRKKNAGQMVAYASAMTEAEMAEIATYYAGLPIVPKLRVVETQTVPKMKSAEGMWLPQEGAEREPIGNRVIETPEDVTRELLRDPRAGFVIYAPPGALEKGKALVTTGGGKTMACAVCHGANLNGKGATPGIIARSPSYAARQLYDFRQGTRAGAKASLMKPVVERLDAADVVNITAYLASLPAPH